MPRAIKLKVLCAATDKAVDVYADENETIADLKRRIDEREGFGHGEHPLCRLRNPRVARSDDGAKLDVLTKALSSTVKHLPADAPERQKQLHAWLSTLDRKLGKGGASSDHAVAAPRQEARVLLDDWDLVRCRLKEGDTLSYGPWCPSQSASLGSDCDEATVAQRTERVGAEQSRIVDVLFSPVLDRRRAAVVDLIVAKDDSQDRAALSELTTTELRKRAEVAGLTKAAVSNAELQASSVEGDQPTASTPTEDASDAIRRLALAQLGYALRVAVSRGFVQDAKDHIANGYAVTPPTIS